MGIVNADINNLKEWADLAVLLFPESSFEEEYQVHERVMFVLFRAKSKELKMPFRVKF